MTVNDTVSAVGTTAGGMVATIKAAITFGATLETVVYSIIGTVCAYLVTELLKSIKKRLTKK